MQRPNGMPQVAWEAYQIASAAARINIRSRQDARVVQAYGNAPASKGFHFHEPRSLARPNVRRYQIEGEFYTAAVDLSVRSLTSTQIATWIEELCRAGFVAFYRTTLGRNNLHIHANYAGVRMKRELQQQCREFFRGEDGLVGSGRIDYEFWYPSLELRRIPQQMFRQSNGSNPRVVSGPALEPEKKSEAVTYALYLNDRLLLWMPVQDGVALAPIRAWGTALGFDVHWLPEKKQVQFDGRDVPIAVTLIAGVGHAPIRQLVQFSGLHLEVDNKDRRVTVTRATA